MGAVYSLCCLKCGVIAPEIGDFGHIGSPSLELKAKGRGIRPFGLIYAACAAVGLLSEELEVTKAFLDGHRGHPVQLAGDGEAEDDGDVEFDEGEASARMKAFRWTKGKFVDAFHVLECGKCAKTSRAPASLPLRPFAKRRLSAADVKVFLEGTSAIDDHVYRIGSPFDFVDGLIDFVARHKAHDLAAALDEGERVRVVKTMRRVKALSTPAVPWTEAGDDRRLGDPADDRLWDALRNLRQKDVEKRRRAIAAIAERPDPFVIGHVVSMLNDPNTEVRALTAATLGVLDDPRRLAFIGRALLDTDEKVRRTANKAATAAGLSVELARKAAVAPTPDPPPKAKGSGSIKKDLFSPIPDIRKAAVELLADRPDDASLTWLSKAVADPDSLVRAAVATALGPHLKRTPRAAAPLALLFGDYYSGAAWEACRAASTTSGDPLVLHIEAMSGDPNFLHAGVGALAALNSAKSQMALIRLTNHPDERVRERAAYTLSQMKPVHVITELMAAVSHKDPKVASSAAAALAGLSLDVVLPTLTAAFREKPAARLSILCGLHSRREKSLLRLFLAGLRDRDPNVRRQAASSLHRRDEAEGRAGLIAAARRGDGTVAVMCWEFLLAAGAPGTEAGLIDAFRVGGDDRMAASLIHSGNRALAAAAREGSSWQPKSFPRIKWGSRR